MKKFPKKIHLYSSTPGQNKQNIRFFGSINLRRENRLKYITFTPLFQNNSHLFKTKLFHAICYFIISISINEC